MHRVTAWQPAQGAGTAPGCSRRARLHLAVALVVALAMGGCAPEAPPRRPVLPVPSDWPADAAAGLGLDAAPLAADLSWQAFFLDPRLRSLVETALVYNRDMRLAVLRVAEARAAYDIRRADQFPEFDLDARGGRSRVPDDLNVTGQPVTASNYGVFVGLASWEIDLWGRVGSLKEAALQDYLGTDATRRAVRVSVIAAVADAYLGLRELDERIALAARTVRSRQESLRIFSRRYQVGATSKLDLTQVQTLLRQAQMLHAQLTQSRAAQAHALGLLLGAPEPPLSATALAPDDRALFHDLRAGLPADLLADRPDIMAAEHALRAARANIDAARAAFFPRIALTGEFGMASVQLSGLFDGAGRAWSFTPIISLPIFDGGRRRANLSLAQVRTDAAVANYEKAIQTAFRDVANALSARHWLTEQVAIQRAALDVQTERARLAQLRYDSGAASYLEVLDAQRDLLDAQQGLVQVRRNLLASNVSLYAALGGGAQNPIALTGRR